ncbi:MAG: alpha/beta hydrolase [Pseudomonadota bacterium]
MKKLVSGLVLFGCVLASACANQVIAEFDPLAIEAETTKRLFVDGNYGQVHVRVATPPTKTERAPLFLLHPSPYSSAFFLDFMEEMSNDRWVIAIDTPGFGDSDRPDQPPSIADYADNAARVLDELGVSEPVDVLGYHTGTLIAAELAIRQPDRVRRLVLPGVPYFTGEAQREAFETYAKPDTLDASGDHHDSKWAFASGGLSHGMSLERAQEHFADLVQAMPESGHAYYGVFSYRGETQFPKLSKPSLFIAPEGSLFNETQAAQTITPNSELVILSEYPNSVFDIGIPFIAQITRDFLDE